MAFKGCVRWRLVLLDPGKICGANIAVSIAIIIVSHRLQKPEEVFYDVMLHVHYTRVLWATHKSRRSKH